MKALVDDLVAICRVFGVFEREAVCCGSVTVPQCVALQALLEGESPSGPAPRSAPASAEKSGLDVGSLADCLGTSPSATTRLLDGLERRGWVRRVRAGDDRRRVDLELTAEGKTEAARLRKLTEDGVAVVLSRIPRSKHAQLVESLRLVRGALEEVKDTLACCGGGTDE